MDLPSFPDSKSFFRRITLETLCALVRNHHPFTCLLVLDCRSPAEYLQGHIKLGDKDAINCHPYDLDFDQVYDSLYEPATLFVFHCEFSAVRAPAGIRRFIERHQSLGRSSDSIHAFVLDGGFSSFYSAHPDLCHGKYEAMSQFAKLSAKYRDLPVPHDRFCDRRQLAVGRTATVYVMTDRDTSQPCVGKVMDESAADWKIPFAAEIHNLSRCRGLPNIAQIVGFTTQSPIMIVLEYCAGGTLADRLDGLSVTEKTRIALKMSLALKTVHAQGLAHLDFRAANIYLGADGEPRLGDFGSSRHVKDLPLKPAGLVTLWEAPEALQGVRVSQAVDVYGFGMLLWVLYHETDPFGGDRPTPQEIIGGKRPEWAAGAPSRLEDFANRYWDAEPLRRPTASEIVGHLCENLGLFGEGDETILADLARHVRSSD
jgi:hypothetical protein